MLVDTAMSSRVSLLSFYFFACITIRSFSFECLRRRSDDPLPRFFEEVITSLCNAVMSETLITYLTSQRSLICRNRHIWRHVNAAVMISNDFVTFVWRHKKDDMTSSFVPFILYIFICSTFFWIFLKFLSLLRTRLVCN